MNKIAFVLSLAVACVSLHAFAVNKKYLVGIKLPDNVSKRLDQFTNGLEGRINQKLGPNAFTPQGKKAFPHHITLAFLQNGNEANLPKIQQALSSAVKAIEKDLVKSLQRLDFDSKVGFIGTSNIVAIYLKPSKDLEVIVNYLRNYLAKYGIQFDTRPFLGHVGLGEVRVQNFDRSAVQSILQSSLKFVSRFNTKYTIPLTHIDLFQTTLSQPPKVDVFKRYNIEKASKQNKQSKRRGVDIGSLSCHLTDFNSDLQALVIALA
jgi:2'-5' RNA ligase